MGPLDQANSKGTNRARKHSGSRNGGGGHDYLGQLSSRVLGITGQDGILATRLPDSASSEVPHSLVLCLAQVLPPPCPCKICIYSSTDSITSPSFNVSCTIIHFPFVHGLFSRSPHGEAALSSGHWRRHTPVRPGGRAGWLRCQL